MVWTITDNILNQLWALGLVLSITYYWLRAHPEAQKWIDLPPLVTFFAMFVWWIATGAMYAKTVSTGSVSVEFPPAAIMTGVAAFFFTLYFLGEAADALSKIFGKVIK